jgi:hypothetical protein
VTSDAAAAGTTLATASKCSAVVVPQTVTKGTQLISITLAAGGTLYYSVPADTDLVLQPQKVHDYNITVNLTGLTVTSTITDWVAVGAVSGNAVM